MKEGVVREERKNEGRKVRPHEAVGGRNPLLREKDVGNVWAGLTFLSKTAGKLGKKL